ncbi:LLM class flavin-dependent oxidoreductase [Microvirga pudoricolor]|uniref:LLM class flavin-dependent oxidoreductase n=1 Tax=Microvirga pudoricolor TaxID=2778729 RepID=UPI001951C045|nr:LLM class flavin-dependent oxidoreductase [Microvirga pudoricolor]MBM6596446.1 LLM class flavin-dependent oxidoreductase [Microvirga pudoricolor]
MLPLSVLDLSFVAAGSTPADALRNTLDLASHVDGLGYTRFWVAEHHNLPSVASGAPEIMIGQIAAVTERIRVGSGGVMLPNHAPLMVAERFKLLEALYPGRIDLGLGRAPGTDPVTSYALRRLQEERGRDDFWERLQELMLLETRSFPDGHPFRKIEVMPSGVPLPPIWLLGSSDYSAHLSARLGLGFAFAHHFANHDAEDSMMSYRRGFQPSQWRETPHAILATAVICAETDEEAERLASSADYNFVLRMRGEFGPIPRPDDALAYPYSDSERALVRRNRERLFVGSPDTVRELLRPLIEATEPDELMITAAVHDHAARKRSYELLVGLFD